MPLRRNDHVGPLHAAATVRCSNLDDGFGRLHVGEVRSAGHDDWVAFADDLGPARYVQSIGDFVGACIDEEDLAG